MKKLILILLLLPSLSHAQVIGGGSKIGGSSQVGSTVVIPSSCPGGLSCAQGWYSNSISLASLEPVYADIQGTTGPAAVMSAWGSAAADTNRSCMIVKGGGHGDYYGNEVYSICATAGGFTKALVHDASTGSQISNLGSTPEAFTDGTPNARHDYGGWVYLPDLDQYLLYGAGLSITGPFSDGNWLYNPRTNAWFQLTPSTHPNTAGNGSIPALAVYNKDHCIYFNENNIPKMWKGCLNSQATTITWTDITGGMSGAPCNNTNFSAAMDQLHGLYVCAGSGAMWTIDVSSLATHNDSAATGCSTVVAAAGPGMDWDPIHQVMVFWVDASDYYTYDDQAHTCTKNTYGTLGGGPAVSSAQANGTRQRFQWSPYLGAFQLTNSMSSSLYILRLGSNATNAATDFTNLCALPGTIICDNFDSSGAMPQRTGSDTDSGLYKDIFDPSSVYMTLDTTTSRAGAGSMLATIPGTAGTNPTGFWRRLTCTSLSDTPGGGTCTMFGNGKHIQFMYSQKMDSPFLTNVWPQTPSGTTYFKDHILSNDTYTCGPKEWTMVNDFSEGYPLTYNNCGTPTYQLNTSLVGSGILNQWTKSTIDSGTYTPSTITLTGGNLNGPEFQCPYSSTQPNADCFDYPVNTWMTFMFDATIGTFGSANSTLACYVSTPSSPAWRQFCYLPNVNLPTDSTSGFDMIELIAYWTSRDNTVSAGPTSHTWYDSLWARDATGLTDLPPWPAVPPAQP